jgi:Zn-dependent protease with chaperone function
MALKLWKHPKSVLAFLLIIFFAFVSADVFASQYYWKAEDIAKNQSTQTRLTGKSGQYVGSVDTNQIRSLLQIKNSLENAIGGSRNYTLYLTEDSDPNAFATTYNGDNVIVFTLGLLRLSGSDNEMLAAVMGHELGHHLKHHLEDSYRTNQLVGLAQIIVGAWLEKKTQQKYHVENLGLNITNLAAVMVSAKFTRDQEREADSVGFHLMVNAGYDPEAAIRLHQTLKRLGKDGIPFLSTHPLSDERISNIRQMILENPEAVKLAQEKSHSRELIALKNNNENITSLQAGDTYSSEYSEAVSAVLNKNYSVALSKFKNAADKGDVNACVHIAYMYRFGNGVPKDFAEAIRWYQMAAKQGNVAALAGLDEMGVRPESLPAQIAHNDSSAPNGYDPLGLKLEIWDGYLTVISISPNAKTTFKLSDRIDKVPSNENGFEGTGIYNFEDYNKQLKKHKIGQQVIFKVLRNGETVYSSAILKEEFSNSSTSIDYP